MKRRNWLPERYRESENPVMTERRIELAAVLLLVALLLWLTLGLLRLLVGAGPEPLLPADDSLAVQALQLEPSLANEDATAILQRPLFWESRRPLAPQVAATSTPESAVVQNLDGVTLHGVFGTGDSLGLIVSVNGVQSRVIKGGSVKGWRFTEYSDGTAKFERRGRQATLPLALAVPSVSIAAARSVDNAEQVADDSGQDVSDRAAVASGGAEVGPDRAEELQREQVQQQMQQLQKRGGLTFGSGSEQRAQGSR